MKLLLLPATAGGCCGALAPVLAAIVVGLAVDRSAVASAVAVTDNAERSGQEEHAHWASEGASFLQLEVSAVSKATNQNLPLFPVRVLHKLIADPWRGVSIKMDSCSKSLAVVSGLDDTESVVARARFQDRLSETGWTKLIVNTTESSRATNDIKMYSAGFLEGILTAVRTSQFYSNFYQVLMRDSAAFQAMANVKSMINNEILYLRKKAGLGEGSGVMEPNDPYWKHARYVYLQLWGFKDAYNYVATKNNVKQLDMMDMILINSHAYLSDLMQAYTPDAVKARAKFQSMATSDEKASFLQRALRGLVRHAADEDPGAAVNGQRPAWLMGLGDHDWEQRLAKRGHCSALVRVAPGNQDLLVGHTTWSDYSKMIRVWKYYNFHLPGSNSAVTMMSFSSYPGCVSSTDDFYLMDSGLVVADTSIELLNPNQYNRVADFPANKHIPNFVHIMAVNRMSHTGLHWSSLIAEQNSGTSIAQWLIVDYNRFQPGKPLGDNTVILLEQIPGITRKADVSVEVNSHGYWASYNRPFFANVRRMSGHAAAEQVYGSLYSFDNGPRATIFKRVSRSIRSAFDMRVVMNKNSWPNEGVVPSEPGHAISARLDLGSDKIPNGGIDAKVTNYCLFHKMRAQGISGPTHDAVPAFKWRENGVELFPGWPHLGMPDEYNFFWYSITPDEPLAKVVDITC